MRNVDYLDYDLITGAIAYTARTSGKESSIRSGMGRIYDSCIPEHCYVDVASKELRERMSFSVNATHSGDNILITGLPVGTTIIMDGEGYLIDDGVLDMDIDQPVSVTYTMEHPHYIKESVTLESP